jgi:selenocysteine-specific elongation factor
MDPQPKGRHKRFDEDVLKSLDSLAQGSPADVLFEAALSLRAAPIKEIVARSRLETAAAERALHELLDQNRIAALEDGTIDVSGDLLIIASPQWNELRQRVKDILEAYHKQFPLRRGIPREELKSRLKMPPRLFNAMIKKMTAENEISGSGGSVSMAGHEIRFDDGQQAKVRALMRKFEQHPFSPPNIKECRAEAGDEILNALIEMNELTAVSAEVIFRTPDYETMVAMIRAAIRERGQITLAETRDMFDTSRKYAQALLEHLDAINVTMRAGDVRRLK